MYLRKNIAVHRMNYTYPASSSLFFCRITFVFSHFAVCLLPQQRRRSVDEGLLCLNAARKIRHNVRKSLITARDVYAYVRLCYWLREKSRSLCRRSQIKDFSRSGAFGGQYAQIILAHQRPISPSTIYTHWMRYMAAIIIDALVLGKSLGLFKPCE